MDQKTNPKSIHASTKLTLKLMTFMTHATKVFNMIPTKLKKVIILNFRRRY